MAPIGGSRSGSPSPGLTGQLSVSVVICAYTLNRWADIAAAMAALDKQTVPAREVVLVVDHNDALLAEATGSFPGVRVLANTGSPGLSGARNTGVRAARGDVVAFLDDDAAPEPEWIEHLLAGYADPDVIGVGGTVLPAWQGTRPQWFPPEFLWVVGCSYVGQPTGRAEIRNAIGANMSFRRGVFDRAGYFDDAVGRTGANAAGCEETEFSIRARQAYPGGRIMLEPAAVCHHRVSPERMTRRYFRKRCAAEGRSKAVVVRLSGTDAALSTERDYLRLVLPRGVLTNLVRLVAGDQYAGARAWMLVEGLGWTAVSYLLSRLRAIRRGGPGRTPDLGGTGVAAGALVLQDPVHGLRQVPGHELGRARCPLTTDQDRNDPGAAGRLAVGLGVADHG